MRTEHPGLYEKLKHNFKLQEDLLDEESLEESKSCSTERKSMNNIHPETEEKKYSFENIAPSLSRGMHGHLQRANQPKLRFYSIRATRNENGRSKRPETD